MTSLSFFQGIMKPWILDTVRESVISSYKTQSVSDINYGTMEKNTKQKQQGECQGRKLSGTFSSGEDNPKIVQVLSCHKGGRGWGQNKKNKRGRKSCQDVDVDVDVDVAVVRKHSRRDVQYLSSRTCESCPPYLIVHDGRSSIPVFFSHEVGRKLFFLHSHGNDGQDENGEEEEEEVVMKMKYARSPGSIIRISGYIVNTVANCSGKHYRHIIKSTTTQLSSSSSPSHGSYLSSTWPVLCFLVQNSVELVGGEGSGRWSMCRRNGDGSGGSGGDPIDIHSDLVVRGALGEMKDYIELHTRLSRKNHLRCCCCYFCQKCNDIYCDHNVAEGCGVTTTGFGSSQTCRRRRRRRRCGDKSSSSSSSSSSSCHLRSLPSLPDCTGAIPAWDMLHVFDCRCKEKITGGGGGEKTKNFFFIHRTELTQGDENNDCNDENDENVVDGENIVAGKKSPNDDVIPGIDEMLYTTTDSSESGDQGGGNNSDDGREDELCTGGGTTPFGDDDDNDNGDERHCHEEQGNKDDYGCQKDLGRVNDSSDRYNDDNLASAATGTTSVDTSSAHKSIVVVATPPPLPPPPSSKAISYSPIFARDDEIDQSFLRGEKAVSEKKSDDSDFIKEDGKDVVERDVKKKGQEEKAVEERNECSDVAAVDDDDDDDDKKDAAKGRLEEEEGQEEKAVEERNDDSDSDVVVAEEEKDAAAAEELAAEEGQEKEAVVEERHECSDVVVEDKERDTAEEGQHLEEEEQEMAVAVVERNDGSDVVVVEDEKGTAGVYLEEEEGREKKPLEERNDGSDVMVEEEKDVAERQLNEEGGEKEGHLGASSALVGLLSQPSPPRVVSVACCGSGSDDNRGDDGEVVDASDAIITPRRHHEEKKDDEKKNKELQHGTLGVVVGGGQSSSREKRAALSQYIDNGFLDSNSEHKELERVQVQEEEDKDDGEEDCTKLLTQPVDENDGHMVSTMVDHREKGQTIITEKQRIKHNDLTCSGKGQVAKEIGGMGMGMGMGMGRRSPDGYKSSSRLGAKNTLVVERKRDMQPRSGELQQQQQEQKQQHKEEGSNFEVHNNNRPLRKLESFSSLLPASSSSPSSKGGGKKGKRKRVAQENMSKIMDFINLNLPSSQMETQPLLLSPSSMEDHQCLWTEKDAEENWTNDGNEENNGGREGEISHQNKKSNDHHVRYVNEDNDDNSKNQRPTNQQKMKEVSSSVHCHFHDKDSGAASRNCARSATLQRTNATNNSIQNKTLDSEAKRHHPRHMMTNSCGYTPLHLAVRNGASPDVVQKLVNANPSDIIKRDFINGETPLDWCVKNCISSRIVGILVRGHPNWSATPPRATTASACTPQKQRKRRQWIQIVDELGNRSTPTEQGMRKRRTTAGLTILANNNNNNNIGGREVQTENGKGRKRQRFNLRTWIEQNLER